MKVKINGMDCSSCIDPYSIRPYHEKRQGPAIGNSQRGDEILDTVAVKNGFEATAGLLNQEQYTMFMLFAKMDYIQVVYLDPDTNTEVTREMMLTAGKPTRVPLCDGRCVYKNISLNFRER